MASSPTMLAPVALVPRPGTSLAELDRWFTTGAGWTLLAAERDAAHRNDHRHCLVCAPTLELLGRPSR